MGDGEGLAEGCTVGEGVGLWVGWLEGLEDG